MEETNIKISVIMPVYGVEKYVGKAIESIQNQTLKDVEIIMVDDGSKDKSGEICDEYAKKDSRIRVIHKENGGAPSARNAAIPRAKGKYLYFMDPDDWAEEDMLMHMYKLAEKHDAQLVVTGFYIDTYYSENDYISEAVFVDDALYEDARHFRENAYRYINRNLLNTPWNKLYRKDYIWENQLLFPDVLWDDWPFNVEVIRNVDRVAVSKECFYHFLRARAESETAKYYPKLYEKRESEHTMERQLFEEWEVYDDDTEEMLCRRYIERFIGCVENLTNPNCDLNKKEVYKEIGKMLQNPRVGYSVSVAKPNSKYMKLMLVPVRLKSPRLLYLECSFISKVKTKHIKTFAKLKANR